jgi:hypothetical protein
MPNGHLKIRLKANSPHIGKRCPVSGRTFQPGDDVVVCEKSDVAFSAKHWQETISMWGGHCQYCNSPIEGWTPVAPDAGIKPVKSPSRGVSVPVWGMVAAGASFLVCGLVAGILLFGGTTGGDVSSSSETEAQRANILAAGSNLQNGESDVGATPTHTPTEVVDVAAEPPTPTHIRIPTRAPTPSRTPTATNTPEPKLICDFEAQGEFRGLWLTYRNRLGCPHQAYPRDELFEEMTFENGLMIAYHSGNPNDMVLVVAISPNCPSDQPCSGKFWTYEIGPPWKEGDIVDFCPEISLPPGRIKPLKGYGKLWCENPAVRQTLGWGTGEAHGVSPFPRIQGFGNFPNIGLILRDSDGASVRGEPTLAYVLFTDGTFVREVY